MGNGITQLEAYANAKKLRSQILASCLVCGGIGYSEETQEECECIDKYRIQALPILARIPDKFQSYRLQEYPGVHEDLLTDEEKALINKVKESLKQYVDDISNDNQKGIIFTGREGSGKTFAATYCMRMCMVYLFPQYVNNTFCTVNDIVVAYNIKNINESRTPLYNKEDFTKGILCIDGLGKEYSLTWKGVEFDTKAVNAILIDILQHRHSNNLPTFISSSQTIDQISHNYSSLLSNIILESMYSIKFPNTMPDWRERALFANEKENNFNKYQF
jgi:DNA replication protein DnaC